MRKSRIRLWLASGCVCAAAIAAIPTIADGASGSPPAVTSAAATNVTSGGATLNGMLTPTARTAAMRLTDNEWLTHETAFASAGTGTTAQPVSAAIASLSPSTTYHFRVIAKSAAGTSTGDDESFTTSTAKPTIPAPSASTGAASQLTNTSVRVNGSLNPKGQATTYYFQYGPTTGYGLQTRPVDAGSGTSTEAVHAVLWTDHHIPLPPRGRRRRRPRRCRSFCRRRTRAGARRLHGAHGLCLTRRDHRRRSRLLRRRNRLPGPRHDDRGTWRSRARAAELLHFRRHRWLPERRHQRDRKAAAQAKRRLAPCSRSTCTSPPRVKVSRRR